MCEQTEDDEAGGCPPGADGPVSKQGPEVWISKQSRFQHVQSLTEVWLCFRGLGLKTGECSVPSQPTLEWTCLKVLGAAELLSCCLQRCSRAFLYPFSRGSAEQTDSSVWFCSGRGLHPEVPGPHAALLSLHWDYWGLKKNANNLSK